MADKQHTQTHPKFTWLFLATPRRFPECSPVVLRFDADNEEEARSAFPCWEMVFAAKIRSECSLYQYANGTFELTISTSEVLHG
ncbi:host cell division inhibitor Icd-like protein [Buttiauxella gaviniae]|uniref:host cell division inhibitor Icd-like protein n=1 Tax=Buttiauxella gaviniae TaxID=82990 RepID=UPI003974E9D0